jgi:uroporphyrin-III C-methyltransferase
VTVYLVGAGPGDPGLITVRGLELLRRCDAVVYDRLVDAELLDETPGDTLRLSREGMGQDDICRVLIELGRNGLEVVRLKGGDPFIFGRGGEEALALAAAGVPYEVVAGVSALAAAPAAAGVPITHRGVSDRVTVISGHSAGGGELDYDALAGAGGTLVVFMGRLALARIAAGLVGAGMPRETPVLLVSRACRRDQRSVVTTLSGSGAHARSLASPLLVVIGDVVTLAGVVPRALAEAAHAA